MHIYVDLAHPSYSIHAIYSVLAHPSYRIHAFYSVLLYPSYLNLKLGYLPNMFINLKYLYDVTNNILYFNSKLI